ncbi:MAG: OmpA family protein [Elusimicrobiota bacterium]
MKKIIVLLLLFLTSIAGAKVLVVDTFNSKQDKNSLGGESGVWLGNPSDETQGCWSEFSDKVKFGEKGSSLYLKFDVDSPNPAFGGYWTKLQNLDARPYKLLVLFIKGDTAVGYPTKFNVELKNASESGKCTIRGVNGTWQKFAVPLDQIDGLTDLSSLTEFVFVFGFDTTDNKIGALYVDDICFSDGNYDTPLPKKAAEKQISEDNGAGSLLDDAKKDRLEARQEEDGIVITVRINFRANRSDMNEAEKKKLGQVAGILKKYSSRGVQIVGYTDNSGNKDRNLELSVERASAVRVELINLGIDAKRLVASGKGIDDPVADNSTAAGRAKNRRVEFIIGQ